MDTKRKRTIRIGTVVSSKMDKSVVVQVERLVDGSRKIISLQEITGMEGSVITMQEIFSFEQSGVDKEGIVSGQFRTHGIRPKFFERFVKMVAYGDDGNGKKSRFGKDISGGFVYAAEKWGRREQDLSNGMLAFPYWGIPIHKEPRAQVYWGYGTLLGDRDINEHDFDWLSSKI